MLTQPTFKWTKGNQLLTGSEMYNTPGWILTLISIHIGCIEKYDTPSKDIIHDISSILTRDLQI